MSKYYSYYYDTSGTSDTSGSSGTSGKDDKQNQFKTLVKSIDELLKNGLSTDAEFLEGLLLEPKDVAKKIIMTSNPKMSKEDVDMIFDTEEELIKKMESEYDKKLDKTSDTSDISGYSSTSGIDGTSSMEIKEEELAKRKESIDKSKKRIKKQKDYYKEYSKSFLKEAENFLKEIKIKIFEFFKYIKEMIQTMFTSTGQLSTSIPGIVMMSAPPSFNFSMAMSYVFSIMSLLNTFISKAKDIVPLTSVFNKLNLVTDDKSLAILSTIINSALFPFTAILELTGKLSELINKLMETIKKLFDKKDNLFKEKTLELRNLGHFRISDNKKYEFDIGGKVIKADNEQSAIKVNEILKEFKVDYKINKVIAYVDDNRNIDRKEIENQINKLNDMRNKINKLNDIPDIGNNIIDDVYLYDIKLPNGEMLVGVKESELEYIKEKYNIIISQIQDMTIS
jgi:hypothetical protein